MEFIEAKIYHNSTLKMPSKKVEERSPQKWRKKRVKKARKSRTIRNRAAPDTALPGTVVPPSTARLCHFFGRPYRVLGARSVRLVSARVLPRFARVLPCFPSFCSSWCSGLPPSSTLPWTYFWSPLFHRNPKISPEMKTKYNLGTIWIEGR